MSRRSWDHYFMAIAREVATRATCDRKHVGAVIVRDKTILSTGQLPGSGKPPNQRCPGFYSTCAIRARHTDLRFRNAGRASRAGSKNAPHLLRRPYVRP